MARRDRAAGARGSGRAAGRGQAREAQGPSLREQALAAIPCDCPGAQHGTDGGRPHWRMGAHGPEPVSNGDGRGPCCDDPRWPACSACPHYPPVSRLLDEMEAARPADAPPPAALGPLEEVEECQVDAFLSDDPEWWRVGAMHQRYCRAPDGEWYPADAPEVLHAANAGDDSDAPTADAAVTAAAG